MAYVAMFGVLLVVSTTVLHYEVLRGLSRLLPAVRIQSRAKLLVVMFAAFVSHAAHIVLYGLGFMVLARYLGMGAVGGTLHSGIATYMYFSAETYTSLGFGDLVPFGATRLLAGVETLNGLLLIGWSASYTYLSMERFWTEENGTARRRRGE